MREREEVGGEMKWKTRKSGGKKYESESETNGQSKGQTDRQTS